jgi:flagellar export protein FliJ
VQKFVFRLEVVKKLRENDFLQARRQVSEQEGVLHREKLAFKTLKERKQAICEERFAYLRDLDLFMANWAFEYEKALEFDIKAQEVRLQEASRELEERKKKMQEAKKAVKVVEKLEEKSRLKYNKERLDFEQKFFDDIAGSGYLRKH